MKTLQSITDRVAALGWHGIIQDLNNRGYADASSVLTPGECRSLAAMYSEDKHFRSRIIMARHGFGRGEYKYWAYPLPDAVAALRAALYVRLSGVANHWNRIMGIDVSYPSEHEEYLARCHSAGQTKPTPLLLQYGEGDTIACTRISTENMCFRCKSPSCCRSQVRTSPGVSSYLRNSGPACNPARRLSS
jgi:uncharacterized protein